MSSKWFRYSGAGILGGINDGSLIFVERPNRLCWFQPHPGHASTDYQNRPHSSAPRENAHFEILIAISNPLKEETGPQQQSEE